MDDKNARPIKKTQLSDPNDMAKALKTAEDFANSHPAEAKAAMAKPAAPKESLLSRTKKRLAKVYGSNKSVRTTDTEAGLKDAGIDEERIKKMRTPGVK